MACCRWDRDMKIHPFASISALFVGSDEQSMQRVRADDDPVAFAQLVRRWQGPVLGLCARMTGDSHLAEDLTQEVFARVFAKRKDYQSSAKFSTWLWRIALNRCYDELRRTRQRGECAMESLDDHGQDTWAETAPSLEVEPDGAASVKERATLVRLALLRLPEAYRSVVVLRHYEDLKFREIAEVLGVPEGTVKSRMAEAMTQLTRILQPTVGESPRPTELEQP